MTLRQPAPVAALAKPETSNAAGVLLKLETDLRQIRTLPAFRYFAANETRLVTRSQQTFVFDIAKGARAKLKAVSTMAAVDPAAPLVVWIEALVGRIAAAHGLQAVREFAADSFTLGKGIDYPGYPLKFMLWVPFLDVDGGLIGGLLQARMTPWTEADQVVSRHVAGACGYTQIMLSQVRPAWHMPRLSKRSLAVAAAILLALCFVPVSMSALAPVEVTPKNAFMITAPVDGVVERVLVEPNAMVVKDQPLIQMADTVLKNRLEVAEREVVVAESKVKKASQLAFVDVRGRHELGVAQAEMHLRYAERDYARDLLRQSTIKAERSGIAFFADPKDLIGRPVAVGERLMELADPSSLEFRIDLPVADAIVLSQGARIKVFLDADPLNPIDARLTRADFQARPRDNQQLAFRLVADRVGQETRMLRLGVRGTAQVYSEKVPLAFYLFRRPLSAVRQTVGF
jgi:HlyD family secretion protein/Biotin-lipoyl like